MARMAREEIEACQIAISEHSLENKKTRKKQRSIRPLIQELNSDRCTLTVAHCDDEPIAYVQSLEEGLPRGERGHDSAVTSHRFSRGNKATQEIVMKAIRQVGLNENQEAAIAAILGANARRLPRLLSTEADTACA